MTSDMEKSYIELHDALLSLVIHLEWMNQWRETEEKTWRSDSPREILAYEALKNARPFIEKLEEQK